MEQSVHFHSQYITTTFHCKSCQKRFRLELYFSITAKLQDLINYASENFMKNYEAALKPSDMSPREIWIFHSAINDGQAAVTIV